MTSVGADEDSKRKKKKGRKDVDVAAAAVDDGKVEVVEGRWVVDERRKAWIRADGGSKEEEEEVEASSTKVQIQRQTFQRFRTRFW